MTDFIKAPFNFVPVSDKVFLPEWADRISQDVPFSDALSGTIHLRITAETPMFIRNGSDRKDSSFSHMTGVSGKPCYFIPGSSIKGEVRSILEIMSFSKMRVDESASFAIREISNSRNKQYEIQRDSKSVHCGWLRQSPDGEGCVIYDHGIPNRISLERIDEYLGRPVMKNHFMAGGNLKEELKDGEDFFDQKSARFKYHLVEQSGRSIKNFHFSPDQETNTKTQNNRVRFDPNSAQKGTIVFTGQPGPRKYDNRTGKYKGKFYEFVFPDDCSSEPLRVDADMLRHFKFIYFSTTASEKKSKEQEVGWLKGLFNDPEKGLPVFFRLDSKGNVKDFGLAYLYKLPYSRTPYTSLPPEHRNKQHHDLAECIFGYTSPDGRNLRGRVHFGSAFSDNAESDTEPVLLALSSPKASYYPIYIRQKGKNGITGNYATYNGGSLSGWKRYHVRQNTLKGDGTYARNKDGTPNINLNTPICPVKEGAVFTSDITFHNLRPEELGALLSALTFHNTKDCFHQLGQGKPYGYGKSTYEVALDSNLAARAGYFMACFEKTMNDWLSTPWLQSEQMKSLISMAHEKVDGQGYNSADFKYMDMEKKDFVQAKNNLEYLQPVSERLRKIISAVTLAGELDEDRRKKMESLVKSVLVRLQELGGEPDEEIKSQLQNLKNDKGARLVLASLRYECEKKMRLQKEAEEEAKRRQEEAEAQKKREEEEAKRRQEEAEAQKKREQEEAAAQKRESSRAILEIGFEKFMRDVPQSYEDWRKKIRDWLEILRKSGEGRKELSNEEQSIALRLLRKFCQSADNKKRKTINCREGSKLIGKKFTMNDL